MAGFGVFFSPLFLTELLATLSFQLSSKSVFMSWKKLS